MSDLAIIGLTFVGTLLGVYWFVRLFKTVPADINPFKNRVLEPEYEYVAHQEDLMKIIEEVVKELSPKKKKMLTNVHFHISKDIPQNKMVDGKTFTLFGEYRAWIMLYPNSLFPHNKNYHQYKEHFRSLIRHEIAHHFGMTDLEIARHKKELGITR